MQDELLVDQPLGQKLIKKGFWLYFFAYLTAPAAYIVKVFISNSVSVADVGVLYTIVSLIGLLNVYNDLGLTESLQYFLPRYRVNKQYNYIKTSIYISLAAQIFTAIIIAIFLWIGAPWLAQHYFHSPIAIIILKYFCFYFLGINLFQCIQSILSAFQDTFNSQFIEFVRMRSILGFTVFFFFNGQQSIQWYSLNWILGLSVGIIVASVIFYRGYRKHLLQGKIVREKPMLKEYFKYTLRSFVGLNASNVFGLVIQQIIIVMMGPEPAGYYTNFLSLFGISGILIGPIMGLIFPMVSELSSKKDTNKLSLLFNFFYTYFSVFSLSLSVLMLVLAQEIALIIFGMKFLFSGSLFARSAIFIVSNSLLGFNFSVLAGMGKIKERVKMLIRSTIITIIISVGLIPLLGIYGAIAGFSIGQLSLFILSYMVAQRYVKISINWLFVTKNLLLMSLLGGMIWYFKSTLFVLDDVMRYSNLGRLIVLTLGFYIIVGLFNFKQVMALKNEIKKLKKI